MADNIGMVAQLAGQSLRLGWYFALNRLVEQRSAQPGKVSRARPGRPVPTLLELLIDVGQLLVRDAMAVRERLYPPVEDEAFSPLHQLMHARQMLADLPAALDRRRVNNTHTAKAQPDAVHVPDYYAQDFHFQSGGYLSKDSARLYDVQVETLFMGAAAPMRRTALRPIAQFMRGRDQRRAGLLDVACGTGRFLRQARLTWPALRLEGLDLSRAYLDEAERHLAGVRPAILIEAAAERMPLADASVDVATAIFLFHELPAQVRREVAGEIARVLKPGGLFVFLDSLQLGDRPAWDGLLEAFPKRFHEPYYSNYLADDLEAVFADAGLEPHGSWTAFLGKGMAWRKAATPVRGAPDPVSQDDPP